jgi:hypothetical protein
MKLWVVVAAGIIAVFIVFMIAVSSGSSDTTASPTPSSVNSFTATTTPSASCGARTCAPIVPTPTAPASCGIGSGNWEQCAKTAVDPAFTDYVTRFSIPAGEELAIVQEERIDWPDSCLGVSTPGVLCAQVITPGFRFVVTAAPGRPFAEYHTDLSGHSVFVASYDTPQEIPPTQTPH